MITFFKKHRKRIQEIGLGLFAWETVNFIFDWIFYPFAILVWGIELGGIIGTVIAIAVNAFVFWLYDYMRVDWLGAHALRQLEDKENKSNLEKLATWLGKKKIAWWEKIASPLVFITLTLPIDPVIVAIHYRRKHFSGVGVRDWMLLVSATLAANLWWILKIGVVIEGARWLLQHFVFWG